MNKLVEHIRKSIVGSGTFIETPFGERPLVYADYTASGRALSFIEAYIQNSVLPYYANTHTETSLTGAQTTALREQSRETIHRSVGGSKKDCVIFCGSGATAAINKLVDILNLRLPRDLDFAYGFSNRIPLEQRPVVFIGPYEHHSNELIWRESIADVVTISLNEDGTIDRSDLEEKLLGYAERPLKIGSFSAASNVTGIKSDVQGITEILKRHSAKVFWDYAAAGPYVDIDMNRGAEIDAVFISPHKFIGGVGTPGVLVVKRELLKNSVPSVVGGGTVSYVTPFDHRYIDSPERREEGGTPAIIESIRAGLVFDLKNKVGIDEITERERSFTEKAKDRFSKMSQIEVLGGMEAHRLSIFSLRFKFMGKDLHYGFVVSLLNDLFGIQVRGGCSCAGPYGHNLLGLSIDKSRAIEREIQRGNKVLRPGWVRLNFNYFIDEVEFNYILDAIELVAEHGWRMLPRYIFDECNGVWQYRGNSMKIPISLNNFDPFGREFSKSVPSKVSYENILTAAKQFLLDSKPCEQSSFLKLEGSAKELCWFVLPQEINSGKNPSRRESA